MSSSSIQRLVRLRGHLINQGPFVGLSSRLVTQHNRPLSSAAQAVLDTRRQVNVLDSHISYLDSGNSNDKNVVIFLHGNPTSSYLWRNIIPHVKPVARCLAPDLIGMGHSGKEPNNSYHFQDHFRYLSEWLKMMDLPEKLNFVVHDWGSGLGFHWCHLNPERVQSISFTEALVSPIRNWDTFPEVSAKVFQGLRSPAGEDMVLKKNFFVEKLLPNAIMRDLSDEEMAEYRLPYLKEGESRRPTLTWPREIPFVSDGPKDVLKIVGDYHKWLCEEKTIPKLYLDPEPGFFAEGIRKVVKHWHNVKTVKIKGLHFVQEDDPDVIGEAIKEFLLNKVWK